MLCTTYTPMCISCSGIPSHSGATSAMWTYSINLSCLGDISNTQVLTPFLCISKNFTVAPGNLTIGRCSLAAQSVFLDYLNEDELIFISQDIASFINSSKTVLLNSILWIILRVFSAFLYFNTELITDWLTGTYSGSQILPTWKHHISTCVCSAHKFPVFCLNGQTIKGRSHRLSENFCKLARLAEFHFPSFWTQNNSHWSTSKCLKNSSL